MDNWFDTLINGTSRVLVAREERKAAAAMAPFEASRVAALDAQAALAAADRRDQNKQYVMWGLGALLVMFIIRATDRG